MAISRDGDFQDEEQFRAFGKLIRETFGAPAYRLEHPALTDGSCEIVFEAPRPVKYAVLREEIGEGQRIRGFRILADGQPVYESECVGHKRIVPFKDLTASRLTVEITKAAGTPVLRDVCVF